MNIEQKDIVDLIKKRVLEKDDIILNSRTSIINIFPNTKMYEKKNGIYALLDAGDIVFYVGHGSIGRPEAIILVNLLKLSIGFEGIIEELTNSNFIFEKIGVSTILILKGIKLNFIEDICGKLFLDKVIMLDENDNYIKKIIQRHLPIVLNS